MITFNFNKSLFDKKITNLFDNEAEFIYFQSIIKRKRI